MKKNNKSNKKITADMTIKEVLDLNKDLADVFMGFGMFCVFCEAGTNETVAQAAEVHDIDVELLLKKLNEFVK